MNRNTADPVFPAYAAGAGPRRIKRVKLALLLSSLAACVSVAILGFIMIGLTEMIFRRAGFGSTGMARDDFIGGMLLAFQYSAVNFFLFFLTIPAAAIAIGFSIARFPGRGIGRPAPYLRWGAIWGAILVASVTGGLTALLAMGSALGALFGGVLVGSLAGTFCGFIFHAIVRPARQIAEADISIF